MQYEQTWRTYETQMEAKKYELQQRRQHLMSKKAAPAPLGVSTPAGTPAPATYSHGAVPYSNPAPAPVNQPQPYRQPPAPQQQSGSYGMPPINAAAGYGGYNNTATDNNEWGAEEPPAAEQYEGHATSWQDKSFYGQQPPPQQQSQYPPYRQPQGEYRHQSPRFNGAGGQPPRSNYPAPSRPGFDGGRPRPPQQFSGPRPGSDVVNPGMRFGARGDSGIGPRPRLPNVEGGVKPLFPEGTIRPLFPEGSLPPPRPDGNHSFNESVEEEDYGCDEDFLSVPREHDGRFGNGPRIDNGSARGHFDPSSRGALRPRFPGHVENRSHFAGAGDVQPRFDVGAYGEPVNKQPRMSNSTRGGGRGSRWGPEANSTPGGGKLPVDGATGVGNDSKENPSFGAGPGENVNSDEPDFSQDFGDDTTSFGYQSFEDRPPRFQLPSQRFPNARGPPPSGLRPGPIGPAARGSRFPPSSRGGFVRPLLPGLGGQGRGGFRPQGSSSGTGNDGPNEWADQSANEDYEQETPEEAAFTDQGQRHPSNAISGGPRPRFPAAGNMAARSSWAAPVRGRGGFDGRGPMPLRFRGRAEGVQFFQGKGDGKEEDVKDDEGLTGSSADINQEVSFNITLVI